jgi:hypothetical protein
MLLAMMLVAMMLVASPHVCTLATLGRPARPQDHPPVPPTTTPQVYRAQIIRRFCTKLDLRTGVHLPRHPAEPLSTAEPGEYLHKPFSVAQTRMSMADSWQ